MKALLVNKESASKSPRYVFPRQTSVIGSKLFFSRLGVCRSDKYENAQKDSENKTLEKKNDERILKSFSEFSTLEPIWPSC